MPRRLSSGNPRGGVGSDGVIQADDGHCKVGVQDAGEVNGQRREQSCWRV